MEPLNIISAYQSALLFSKDKEKMEKFSDIQDIMLKPHEMDTLEKFICLLRKEENFEYSITNGYYIGYKINQISKEFDLLRFSDNLVVNIELKSKLSESCTIDKILSQMKQNFFYLKFLRREICIFTYVGENTLYYFNNNNNWTYVNIVDTFSRIIFMKLS